MIESVKITHLSFKEKLFVMIYYKPENKNQHKNTDQIGQNIQQEKLK